MKKQKFIALGLAVGIMISGISPTIAGTINGTNAVSSTSEVIPFDMEKYKDSNKELGNKVIDNDSKLVSSTSYKKRANATTKDFEEMSNSGMTHDEIVDVLETAGEQGEQIEDIITDVKKEKKDNKISKENLKKVLSERKKINGVKKQESTGNVLKEYIIGQQKAGKIKNSKIIIVDDEKNNIEDKQDGINVTRVPEAISPVTP